MNGAEFSTPGQAPKNGFQHPPLVSVIIPAFNAQNTIAQTLVSVLNGTWNCFEVVVVDDGSTDGTAQIVEEIARTDSRIRICRQENRGVAEARNRGIRESAGEWIAPLDADDIWNPENLEHLVRQAQAAGDRVAVIYSWSTKIDGDNLPLAGMSVSSLRGSVFPTLLCHNFLGNGSCTLIRRSALESVGGYDQRLSPAEDWDLYLRLAEHYEFMPVKRFLIQYRQSRHSASSNYQSMADAQTKMLLDVRRRNPRVPAWLCCLSQSNLYVHIAKRSREQADAAAVKRWLLRATAAHWLTAMRPDWWWLLAFGRWRTSVRPAASLSFTRLPGLLSRLMLAKLLHKSLHQLVRFRCSETVFPPQHNLR